MNIFKDKDPMGLKKLDKELSKTFSSFKSPGKKTKKQKKNKIEPKEELISKSDIENMRTAYKYTKSLILTIQKLVNKNRIPKKPDEIFSMEERLDREQISKAEAERSIKHIKELKAQEKKFRKQERKEKWHKTKQRIKDFFNQDV